ncbi:hypothetical protein MTBLM5_60124 [Magnetospirillum sp. LM-5]|nr:hypothetical protein MTBLM5_60124 [Magnetospirillum sp. LM-5]
MHDQNSGVSIVYASWNNEIIMLISLARVGFCQVVYIAYL